LEYINMEKPLILIPEKNTPVTGMPPEVKNRFEKIDNLLFGIITSVVISGIAVVVAVVGLFIDQMRYNNVAYKEYSQKSEAIEMTQKTNEILLKQIQGLSEQNK